jgi:L-aspartate oxidase
MEYQTSMEMPLSPSLAVRHRSVSHQQSPTLLQIRSVMDRQVGVIREECGLKGAICDLRARVIEGHSAGERDAALVSLLIAISAYARSESRGAHQRLDHPDPMPEQHTEMTLDQALRIAAEIDHGIAAPVRRVA